MKTKLPPKVVDFYLVQGAICGDQRAYTEIFRKYRPVLTRQIAKYIRDEDTVDDVVMETFEKAFARLPSFKPDYQLSAWLVRIGTNLSIDYMRKINRHTHVSIDQNWNVDEDFAPIQIQDTSLTPDEELTYKQFTGYLKELVATIENASAKQALKLRFFDNFSYDEIADEMDIELQQAKNLVHRAKKELGKVLKKENY